MKAKAYASGLIGDGENVPLEGVRIEGSIRGFAARVTFTQNYRNRETKPIEAVYVFPLDEASAVCGFETLVDGTHIVGEVKQRDKAFDEYDDAISAGHGAFLLDEERPDAFTANIGNLPAGKSVCIRITYITELQSEGNDFRFVLPLTVSPRYAPVEDRVGVGRTQQEILNPPVEWTVPYGLDLELDLEMPSRILRLESPSHALSSEIDGHRAKVRPGTREIAMDRDFILRIGVDEAPQPRAFVETDPLGRRAAVVFFNPKFDIEEVPSEIIFLVDRSGSMGGDSIAEARNTLELCLRSLPQGTRFNIVGFGTTFESLFEGSRLYDDSTLHKASEHLREMQANLGGTEILPALKAIFQNPADAEFPRQLFVLTDGEVSNTDAVINLVRENRASTRLFSFGIGAGASHHLVRGIARAGNGSAEFVYPGERIETKVLRQLQRALRPPLSDVRLDWNGLKATQAPHGLPAMFPGEWFRVYALLDDAGAGHVKLTGASRNGSFEAVVSIDPEFAQRGSSLTTLAARTLIRDLEEGTSALHERKGSLLTGRIDDRVKAEIVRLGVAYGLCSRETSFLAVEKRDVSVDDEMQLRRVPIALTYGWGGLAHKVSGASLMALSQKSTLGVLLDRSVDSCAEERPMLANILELLDVAAADPRPYPRLISLQRADGSWTLDAALAKILGRKLSELRSFIKDAEGDHEEIERVWATALAVAWLKSQQPNREPEWRLLVKKATRRITDSAARLKTDSEWLAAATQFISG
ncbi:MAG TPA: VIT domain-containing protein [Terriglobia bacterium]|nr:VIT domain-containing protein [Terriglobia bacterium]